ncbi:MAG: hypothetical protein ABIK68_14080, partial [bacterium]
LGVENGTSASHGGSMGTSVKKGHAGYGYWEFEPKFRIRALFFGKFCQSGIDRRHGTGKMAGADGTSPA